MLIFLFTFLILGVILYFGGVYIRKNPYSQIKNDFKLSKMALSPEAIDLYVSKTAKANKLLGIFYIVFAVVQYFIGSFELSFAMIFIPIVPFIVYYYHCRKILTGKFNIVAATLISLSVILPLAIIAPAYIESLVIVNNEQIRITGIYGERIPIERLEQVFLSDTLPSITIRTNGISMGRINKGHFRSSSLQRNVKLLLHSRSAPFLYIIHSDDRHVIVNFRNPERTMEVYEKLRGLVRE